MATFTAVGPRLGITGPRPVAPPHSLLNTPGVLVPDDEQGRWQNGVNVIGFPADVPALWEPCVDGGTKDEGTPRPQATFDAFFVYVPVTCSTIGSEGLEEQASAVLEATQSYGVELALAAGIANNPFFGDASMTALAGGAAVSPAVGLSYLENAIGATGRKGMIHATPAVIASLEAFPLAGDDTLVTANGTPVVSGDGYIGLTPTGEAAPAAGQDWIYATGPVEVRLGPYAITDLSQSLDRSINEVTFRAERSVIAYWDTALQAGVLVDWAA